MTIWCRKCDCERDAELRTRPPWRKTTRYLNVCLTCGDRHEVPPPSRMKVAKDRRRQKRHGQTEMDL